MLRMQKIRAALLIFCAGICASACAAQDNPQSSPGTPPAPAFGQNAPVLSPDNPPVTGLDQPSLDLRSATRSFFAPALQLSESADTNGGNQLNGSDLESISRVVGALDLQKFWTKSDLFLEYLGGAAFYANPYQVRQLQDVGIEGVTRWRTGQATLRDSFSYLPDGSFQIGYGGLPGLGLTNTGMGIAGQGTALPGSLTNEQFGSVGDIPRLANTAIVDAVQAISPVSAITVVAGYSNAHFYDPTHTLINSDQVVAEGGYSHLISRHDQIGAIYAFQLFQFPQNTGGEVFVHVFNLRWSHTLTGRLSLIAGAGPQYIDLQEGGNASYWSLSARVQLHYKMGRSSVIASYEKFTSAGSGFFAGANTQAARLGYIRPLARTWQFFGDLNYSHNTKIQQSFLGVNANHYDGVAVEGILRKHLGRTYDFFTIYRFGDVSFNAPVCITGSCGRSAQRQTGTIGVEWHPRPMRIE